MKKTRTKKYIVSFLIIALFVGGIALLLLRLRGENAKEIAAAARVSPKQDDILGDLGNPDQNSASAANAESPANAENSAVSNPASNSSTVATSVAPSPANNTTSTASQNASSALKITDRLVSWGFLPASNRSIDTIIIHSTYNAVGSDPYSLDDIINKEYKPVGVSPHYIIDRSGNIYRLVEDKNIAYHAGVSQTPDGRTDVNTFSIGIEIVETKSDSPSGAQYNSLKELLTQLKSEYKIKYVLGHYQISPGRKTDPWNFDWSRIK